MQTEATEAAPRSSADLGELAKALAKAQGAMTAAKKDSENPYFSSRYADLATVWEVIRKPLVDNGLCIIQQVTSERGGVSVATTLLHSSGQFVRDNCWLPVAQQTPQAYGSAITYARRYSLSALVGVTADEDDDGNAASAPRAAPPKTTAPKPQPQATKPKPQATKPQPPSAQAKAAPEQASPEHDELFDRLAVELEACQSKADCMALAGRRKAEIDALPPALRAEFRKLFGAKMSDIQAQAKGAA